MQVKVITLPFEDQCQGFDDAPVACGIPFLGFVIRPGGVRLQGAKWRRFRRRMLRLEAAFVAGILSEAELAQRVTSMIGHVAHADVVEARRRFFEPSLALV